MHDAFCDARAKTETQAILCDHSLRQTMSFQNFSFWVFVDTDHDVLAFWLNLSEQKTVTIIVCNPHQMRGSNRLEYEMSEFCMK